MICITVANAKGGVGKSCISTHLAASYAMRGLRTLLIDMDKQGHATQRVGIDAHPEAKCIGDVLTPPYSTPLANVLVQDVRPNLDVAPGLPRMKHLEPMLYADAVRFRRLKAALDGLQAKPDVVLIDTSPNVGPYTENALYAADLVIAPLAPHAGADQGFDDLMAHLESLKEQQNYLLRGAINMLDRRTKATNAALDSLREEMEVARFRTEITRSEAINQAQIGNTLIFDYDPGHTHARLFDELADEAWALVQPEAAA